MERATELPAATRSFFCWSWRRIVWQILPAAAIGLGAFLLALDLTDGEANSSPSARVDSQYEERLAANIEFFETRVTETRDSLSYNRLVSLYLERLRLTGDTSDVVRAELAATNSVELAPKAYASILGLARVRLAQHNFEEVLVLTARAEVAKPGEPDTLAVSGDAKMALGQYQEAGNDYRKYLDLTPGFSAFSRGAIHAEAYGNVALAEQFWNAAIDATRIESPVDSAWARVQLGNLQATNGELGNAQREFEMALRIYPDYALAEAGLARVAAMRGDFDEAFALYARVTAKLPSPEFVALYAEVARRAGEPGVAERQEALIGALSQLFESNGIRNDITLILFSLDHGSAGPEALAQAEQAYHERPSLAAADAYGWALYRSGRFEEAARYANEAIRLGTRDPLYLFHAGMVAVVNGESARARELLQGALAINDEFHPLFAPEARTTLKNLGDAR